jgi:fluoroacetyl-CoA thioesterase
MLEIGLEGYREDWVSSANTAAALGSGELAVYATPAMAALMEGTCMDSVAGELEPGAGTVGISLSIQHTSATPLGERVWCESRLAKVEGRRLVFAVTAYDKAGVIGEGTHERVIIQNQRFLEKANKKRG